MVAILQYLQYCPLKCYTQEKKITEFRQTSTIFNIRCHSILLSAVSHDATGSPTSPSSSLNLDANRERKLKGANAQMG